MNGVFQSAVTGVYSVGNDTYWLNSGIIEEEAGLKRVVKENGEVNYYYFVTSADKEANKGKDLDFTPSKAVKGNKEVENAKEVIKENFTIVNQSRVYKGRGTSMYSNVYLDVEAK